MKVENVTREVIYHMVVDGVSYKRYSENNWVKLVYFDLVCEDYDVVDDGCEKLEKLFIDYMLEENKKDEEFHRLFD